MLLSRAERLWREALCGLGGHAMILRIEPDRLSLQCMECGHSTPGWRLGREAPARPSHEITLARDGAAVVHA